MARRVWDLRDLHMTWREIASLTGLCLATCQAMERPKMLFPLVTRVTEDGSAFLVRFE